MALLGVRLRYPAVESYAEIFRHRLDGEWAEWLGPRRGAWESKRGEDG